MIPVLWEVYLLSTGKWVQKFQQNTTPPTSESKGPQTSQLDCIHYEIIAHCSNPQQNI
jgi:hypothetical protein